MLPSLLTTALVFLAAQDPQHDDAPPEKAARPATDVAAKLRVEDARLQRGPASDFFAALIQASQPGSREGLAGEVPDMNREEDQDSREALQAPALIKEADQVTRHALRFWLARALAPGSRPPTLEEWQNLKARVVGHAEAIVLEAVLRPEQARKWRDSASRPLMPSLPGRYSIIPIDYIDGHIPRRYTRGEYYNVIHQEVYELRVSEFFDVLLGCGRDPFRLPGLTPQQAELLERVELAGSACEAILADPRYRSTT